MRKYSKNMTDEEKLAWKRDYMRQWNKKHMKKVAKRNNQYRKNHPNKKKWAKHRKDKIRAAIDSYKKTLVCEICGENHVACLDFHHIDPSTKLHGCGVGKMVVDGYSVNTILTHITEHCQVLCSNCHRKFHWEEKQCEK